VQQLVFEAATLMGLAAAALAALVLVGNGAGLVALVMRTMVIGGSVFLFAVLGGQVVGRILLESLAKKELEIAKAEQNAQEQAGLKDVQDKIAALKQNQGAMSEKQNPDSENSVSSKAA